MQFIHILIERARKFISFFFGLATLFDEFASWLPNLLGFFSGLSAKSKACDSIAERGKEKEAEKSKYTNWAGYASQQYHRVYSDESGNRIIPTFLFKFFSAATID